MPLNSLCRPQQCLTIPLSSTETTSVCRCEHRSILFCFMQMDNKLRVASDSDSGTVVRDGCFERRWEHWLIRDILSQVNGAAMTLRICESCVLDLWWLAAVTMAHRGLTAENASRRPAKRTQQRDRLLSDMSRFIFFPWLLLGFRTFYQNFLCYIYQGKNIHINCTDALFLIIVFAGNNYQTGQL